MSTISPRGSPAIASCCAMARRRWSSWPRRSCAASRADPAAYRAAIAGLFDQPGGERIDVVVNACTHFPLVADELAAAAPHPVRFVDGAAGIARRVAHLTAGQDWPATPEHRAVFTRLGDAERRLAPALARYGITRIEAL